MLVVFKLSKFAKIDHNDVVPAENKLKRINKNLTEIYSISQDQKVKQKQKPDD